MPTGIHLRIVKSTLVLSLLIATSGRLAIASDDNEGFRIGITGGVAAPSNTVAAVYSWQDVVDDPHRVFNEVAEIGIHFGARMRIGLTQATSISASVSLNRFPNLEQVVGYRKTTGGDTTIRIQTASNVVPITAGVTLVTKPALFRAHLSMELAYVRQNVTLVSDNSIVSAVLQGQVVEPTFDRYGAVISGGLGVNLGVVHPFLEVRYLWLNLIGQSQHEPARSLVEVSLGIML